MKIQIYAMAVAGLFALGSAAMGQGQGTTSGPAAGSNVRPPTGQDASGVTGASGSKNGPAARTGSNTDSNAKSPTGGTVGSAAGVAGPAGSKNGPPPQRGGSANPQK
jgi:hypothetical protein